MEYSEYTFIPLIIFYKGNLLYLFVSLFLGVYLFLIFEKGSLFKFLILLIIVTIIVIVIKPRFGMDAGFLNVINSQRGEHDSAKVLAKLLHNKINYFHIFLINISKLLSPAAIFANGFWYKLNPYYPLGYLFPWDIFFLGRFITNRNKNTNRYFWASLVALLILSGLLYVDQAIIFSLGVVYFISILVSLGYYQTNSKLANIFISMNLIYVLIQLNLTSYFKI